MVTSSLLAGHFIDWAPDNSAVSKVLSISTIDNYYLVVNHNVDGTVCSIVR